MIGQNYKVHFQKTQKKYIKLEILNDKDIKVDEIQGVAVDGNITIDAMSTMRRVCDLRFVFNKKFIPNESSPIWLNKRFRLLVGIENIITNEVVYFNFGVFIISNPTIDIQVSGEFMSIKGYDKTCMLDGTISGELDAKIVINQDIPIHDAIRSTAEILGGETRLLIDTHEYNTPYKIEKDAGTTVWEILDELRKLYMNWELYYDVDGYLRFNKIKNKLNDMVIYDFLNDDLITAKTIEIDFENIKNYFRVYGKLKEDGSQPMAEISITNANYPNSPFTIEKIKKRSLIKTEDNYFTEDACIQGAEYEKFLHTNFNEKVNFTCIPLLFLDVNKLINFNSPNHNLFGKYVIENISLGLKFDSLMNITAYKVY